MKNCLFYEDSEDVAKRNSTYDKQVVPVHHVYRLAEFGAHCFRLVHAESIVVDAAPVIVATLPLLDDIAIFPLLSSI